MGGRLPDEPDVSEGDRIKERLHDAVVELLRFAARLPRSSLCLPATATTLLRLRSLAARGRAKDPTDAIVARVFRLPNELCWHVLQFWHATDATGEVF